MRVETSRPDDAEHDVGPLVVHDSEGKRPQVAKSNGGGKAAVHASVPETVASGDFGEERGQPHQRPLGRIGPADVSAIDDRVELGDGRSGQMIDRHGEIDQPLSVCTPGASLSIRLAASILAWCRSTTASILAAQSGAAP